MRYLGVDYGKKKIGLAVSEGLVATPLKVLQTNSLADSLSKVKSEIKREGIDELVVGVPESGESLKLVKTFIAEICKIIKVVESPETLSSQKAQDLMLSLGKGRKERSIEDAYSATLILQEYLDAINNEEKQ